MSRKIYEPTVSFLIPTYNADKYLFKCLNSIKDLDYPKSKIEIIIADGGSTDKTIEIAHNFAVKLINNDAKIAEFGKRLAYEVSDGELIVFLDSDNVLASRDWLKALLKPFEQDQIIGVESAYLIANDFTLFNVYANLLIIVDPLARMMADKPMNVIHEKTYDVKKYKKSSAVVSGANGFIWRRSALERYKDKSMELNEVSLMGVAARESDVSIGMVPDKGIYHYYCETMTDYIAKRKKIAGKHLDRADKGSTWVDRQSSIRFLYSVLFLATFIGPTFEGISNAVRTKRKAWLLHPIMSFATIAVYINASISHKLNKVH